MINAPTQLSSYGIPDAIIEKSILTGNTRMMFTEYIRKAPRFSFFVRFPDFRIETNVSQYSFRIVHIYIFRRDVKITAPDYFILRLKMLLEIFFQTCKPGQLICKLRAL